VSVLTGRLVAVARCVRLPEDEHTAEWAIVVCDGLQGQGLGTALIRALADEALHQGIHRFRGTVAGENRAVLRLLHHVTDQFATGPLSRGVRDVFVELEPVAV
jgi:L-amino acid N-acyltransferase YncA